MKKKEIFKINKSKCFQIHLLTVGQTFKSFAELYRLLTDEDPPTGKKNQDARKSQFKKYFEWKPLKDVDPNITSKRAIIITKIYDSPITIPENRGKQGKYSDYLKPLLLLHGSFNGTVSMLFWKLEIFKRFYGERYKEHLPYELWRKSDSIDLLPWRIPDSERKLLGLGEYIYKRKLWHCMRTAAERSLKSLQQEGKIKYKNYYQILPDYLTDIEETNKKRPKTKPEIQQENRAREVFLHEVCSDPNCILDFEQIIILDIFSKEWAGEKSKETYRQMVCAAKSDILRCFPLRATSEQEKAIEHLETFLRQYTYKKYKNMVKFPAIEDVPDEFKFFSNPGLNYLYMQNVKALFPLLVRCKKAWKEMEYTVIEKPNSTDLPSIDFLSEKLSIAFFEYMDKQMNKVEIFPRKKDVSDIKNYWRIFDDDYPEEKFIGRLFPLKRSISAERLHNTLKQLYYENSLQIAV